MIRLCFRRRREPVLASPDDEPPDPPSSGRGRCEDAIRAAHADELAALDAELEILSAVTRVSDPLTAARRRFAPHIHRWPTRRRA